MADWFDTTATKEWEASHNFTDPTTRYLAQLQQFGGSAGRMLAYPSSFDTSYRWYRDLGNYGVTDISQLPANVPGLTDKFQSFGYQLASGCRALAQIQQQIDDYSQLKSQFIGGESTYIQWLIGNQITQLNYQMSKQRETNKSLFRQKSLTEANIRDLTGQPEKAKELRYLAGQSAKTEVKPFAATPPPVPDWMKEYLETSMPVGVATQPTTEGRGRGQQQDVSKLASTLRPMGAQAELSPEQMGQMAGYQAWGKAGSPYGYSEGAITEMADWERWWAPHVRLSQELFPTKAKLGTKWMPASQR